MKGGLGKFPEIAAEFEGVIGGHPEQKQQGACCILNQGLFSSP